MRGKYRIVVRNKRICYDFEIKRNITVIRGDSATGKTVLVEMIREFQENGIESGIVLECKKRCAVISGKTWSLQLSVLQDTIIFIDEGNNFVVSKDFAAYIQKTNNYYVIITRESLPALPYSVEEIYGIRNSGKYGSIKQTYNEMFQLYGIREFSSVLNPEQIITEDANAGFQFFNDVCRKSNKICISAHGKSNIFPLLTNAINNKETLIIADGAAFGSEIEKLIKILEYNAWIHIYLPESFEWLILKSGLLTDSDLGAILNEPYLHIDSAEDFSWERFFTKLLTSRTADTYMSYTKRILNPFYLQKNVELQILQVIKKIKF